MSFDTMEAFLNSFLFVFLSEMGDKTQLLAIILAARFRQPFTILLGIMIATILNHALATYVGVFITRAISEEYLRWILALTFIGFGLWILKPDKEEEFKDKHRWGPLLTTTFAFFFAEMGDKTQLATVALAANYIEPVRVTLGTTLGMLAANGPAVFLGHKFTNKIPMKIIHRFASALFILFGLGILVGL